MLGNLHLPTCVRGMLSLDIVLKEDDLWQKQPICCSGADQLVLPGCTHKDRIGICPIGISLSGFLLVAKCKDYRFH